MRKRNLESDCLALLSYIWANRDEEQTYNGLAEGTGIPYETIRQMIQYFEKNPNQWALRNYGMKYGYSVRFVGKKRFERSWSITETEHHVLLHASLDGHTATIEFQKRESAEAFRDRWDAKLDAMERRILDVVYVGTTQNEDGKLFVEDVPEFHGTRESQEIVH